MSSKAVNYLLQSKIFVTLFIIVLILSSSVLLLSPVEPSTPKLNKITVPDERTFNLSDYPVIDRRVIGLWNSLREMYAVDDFSNESINDLSILPNILTQYFIAFTTYGMAQIVDSTPSYRTDYYKKLFQKLILMMNSSAMEDFEWILPGFADDRYEALGNDFRGPTNIMWTGHYALMELLYYNIFRESSYNAEIKWFMDDWNNSLTATTTWDNKTSVDGSGRPLGLWGTGLISCEPYIVFVQCNSIPFYAMTLYDKLHGTNYRQSIEPGIDWWREHMTDANGIQIDGYYIAEPYTEQHQFEVLGEIPGPALEPGLESENIPGVANYGSSWAIAFYNGFGKTEIADTYYRNWKKQFVHYSPNDQAYAPHSYHRPNSFTVFDLIGNLFSYFCSREMNDLELFRKLENWFYGPFPGEWDGYKYGFDTGALGDIGPFMNPILNFAYAWCHADSTLTNLMDPRDDSFYTTTPFISKESTLDGLFIYQAYFDEEEDAFILTVEANKETILTFYQFPDVQGVYTKSGAYEEAKWEQNGDQMVLTLPPGTYSFVII
ncbi:MAG: hypothetical protein JSW11_03000 [Candidatus Heimdallarchaeota archaeon]|nr:MAG: hypothetical protein JSW11_03000 [Candidatus Heimdallarchaeota archaeon]